jgi:predicted nucleotidyltransferase
VVVAWFNSFDIFAQSSYDVFVQRLCSQYKEYVRSVILFGSKARGDAGPESDVDLLVRLTSDDPYLRSKVRRLAARVSLEYDLLLSVQAVSPARWDELSRYRFPLYQAIEAEGIALTPQPQP